MRVLILPHVIDSIARMAALMAGTLISEDLTCVGAGLLARAGRIELWEAIAGCLLGIVAGDAGLWAVGRFAGRRALEWRWLGARRAGASIERASEWVGRKLPWMILGARFLPGCRLPMFVLAGMSGRPAGPFVFWTFVAASLWTPLIVAGSAWIGETFARAFGSAAAIAPFVVLAALALLRIGHGALRDHSRARLGASMSRLWRWEFWPAWLFYLPLVPWIALLSFRYKGFATIAAANPGIPDGGFVGESKAAILAALPPERVLPFARLDAGGPKDRLAALLTMMDQRGWRFPIVLKPDAGQRGAGVRLVRDEARALLALGEQSAPILAQVYHPGPGEAGIFYYRFPGEARGRIFSVTDKIFPSVMGDGIHSIEWLIARHPRHRMQARVFLHRLGERARAVPAEGEVVALGMAGNHCQGTMFRDGGHLVTQELERAVDDVARRCPGFYFGRFDVRYERPEDLRAGRFAIVELNGVTSESTNIYDPSRSLLWAWWTLARQWGLLFRIGSLNLRAGASPSSSVGLLRAALRHRRHPSLGCAAD